MRIKTMIMAASAAVMAVALAVPAQAEWTPERPIQIVVGFAPGGGTDATARLIASAAQEFFPVPLVVVNRPGASGTLAAELVANAEPDGYTLLVAGGSESTSVPNHLKTNYKLDQFRGVIRVNREHMVIVTKKGSGLDSIDKVVEQAKIAPGTLTYGSSGPASILHSSFLVLEKDAGIKMTHVPYKGGAPALAALLGGHVDMTILTPADAQTQSEAGNVNALATTSDRAAQLPDVKSLSELGYNVNLENMKGLVAPAATPDEVVAYLHERFKKAMESETFASLAGRAKIVPGYLNGADFEKAMQSMSASIAAALGS
ncbi:tripartite tricarboxylate transporter substrate binding protein [Thalassobaculum sp. OXR-137]|uniref:tripartite tricarboxylate transporter substrate binding protein n=1 Tax=Thalassobaculum sp. OXR-137 TaxID=3100173 RepID=UPI002AC9D812|nr:tripartite tricarboxylate transporter substrate binding protein [Thalassobaculum sp. OXR-137]WPZ32742.1 tripartite tricarboxylate transporter substrate binding protein [Thalassobaculum sp. OXR-137]